MDLEMAEAQVEWVLASKHMLRTRLFFSVPVVEKNHVFLPPHTHRIRRKNYHFPSLLKLKRSRATETTCQPSAMVLTRSQTKALEQRPRVPAPTVLTRSQAQIAQLVRELSGDTFARTRTRAKGHTCQRACKKADAVVTQFLVSIDQIKGKDAKIRHADRLFDYLAQTATATLFRFHPTFALSVLAKLAEFRKDPAYPTVTVDRHVHEIFQRRGMFEHVAFYRHPTALARRGLMSRRGTSKAS